MLDFPRVEGTSEENARRVMVEATRLASLAPGEWRLWIDRSAERLRIPRATLEDVIAAIIKDSEKKARDAETAARRHERAVRREQERKQREQKREQERTDKRAEHKRKEREKAFESLISLPSEQQETKLGELAQQLDEDVAAVGDHFTAFVGMEGRAASTDSWNVELWPDPVETQALLRTISAKIRKYIVLRLVKPRARGGLKPAQRLRRPRCRQRIVRSICLAIATLSRRSRRGSRGPPFEPPSSQLWAVWRKSSTLCFWRGAVATRRRTPPPSTPNITSARPRSRSARRRSAPARKRSLCASGSASRASAP